MLSRVGAFAWRGTVAMSFAGDPNDPLRGFTGRSTTGRSAVDHRPKPSAADRCSSRLRRIPCRPSCLGVPAALLLLLGVALLAGGGPLVRYYIQKQLPLDDPSKLVFKVWSDTNYDGISVKRRFYMFNVLNPVDVVEHHAVPDLARRGPYVFRETQFAPEEDIFYGPDGTVGYVYRDFFKFLPEESYDENGNPLSLDDIITTANMPFFALMHRLKMYPSELIRGVACLELSDLVNALGDTGIFVQRSVDEILFGYEDPLFVKFKALSAAVGYNVPTVFRYMWNGSLPAPSPYTYTTGQKCPVWDDLAVCNQTSINVSRVWSGGGWGVVPPVDPEATEDEIEHVRGGITDLPRGVKWVGSHAHWAGQTKMWWWGAPETHGGDCQSFAGGAGMTYPPNMGSVSEPYVFVDCIYRKIRLAFDTSGTVKGIPAMRFVIAPDELHLGGPNQRCYFQEYTGAFNMTPVVFAPLVVTGNMFADFDLTQRLKMPSYHYPGDERRAVNVTISGQGPAGYIAEEYPYLQTYLKVYPDAGMLLEGAARLQSNVWLQPPVIDGCESSFDIFKPKYNAATNTTSYFPETLLPVFYLSREAVVSDKIADYIHDNVLVMFTIIHALGGVAIALGILCGAGAAVVWNGGSRKHIVAAAHHHHHHGDEDFGEHDNDDYVLASDGKHRATAHDNDDAAHDNRPAPISDAGGRRTPRFQTPAVPDQEGAAARMPTPATTQAFALRRRPPPGTRGSGGGGAW